MTPHRLQRAGLKLAIVLGIFLSIYGCAGVRMTQTQEESADGRLRPRSYPVSPIRLYEKALETADLLEGWRIERMDPSLLKLDLISADRDGDGEDADRLNIAIRPLQGGQSRLEIVSTVRRRLFDFGQSESNLLEFIQALENRIETP